MDLLFLFSIIINNDLLYIPLLLLLATFLDKKAVYYLIAAIILVLILKPLLAEPRPCSFTFACEPGYGFPSGHTTLIAAIAFSQIKRKRFLPLLILTLLVAYSRVYLGLHSVGQVLGGMAVAAFLIELDKALKWTHKWEEETYLRPILRRFGLCKYIKPILRRFGLWN